MGNFNIERMSLHIPTNSPQFDFAMVPEITMDEISALFDNEIGLMNLAQTKFTANSKSKGVHKVAHKDQFEFKEHANESTGFTWNVSVDPKHLCGPEGSIKMIKKDYVPDKHPKRSVGYGGMK